jgi:hypothetical protein
VPEYDAFGRPIGEDPLAALRGAPEPLPDRARRPDSADSAPTAAAPVPAAPAAPPAFVHRRRRGRGALVAFFVVAALVGVGLAAVPAIVGVTEDVADGIRGSAPPERPRGLDGDSLIRRANFAEAMTTLRGAELGRPVYLRVAPERIDATLIGADGRVHQVQVTFEGELRRFSTSEGGAGQPTIPYERIQRSAPERLVRRGAKQVDLAPGDIDYLVVGPDLTWGAYFTRGAIVQGDARGRPRRVVSAATAPR